jgi:hypothetical protein
MSAKSIRHGGVDMAEVAFRKVLGIKFRSRQQQYFLLKTKRGENIVDHPSTSRVMNIM